MREQENAVERPFWELAIVLVLAVLLALFIGYRVGRDAERKEQRDRWDATGYQELHPSGYVVKAARSESGGVILWVERD